MKNDAQLQHLSTIKTVEFKNFTPDGLKAVELNLSRYEYFTSKDSDCTFNIFAVTRKTSFRSLKHNQNVTDEEILFTDNELDTAEQAFATALNNLHKEFLTI